MYLVQLHMWKWRWVGICFCLYITGSIQSVSLVVALMAIFHLWRHKGNLWLVGADHPGGNNNSAVNQTRWMIVSGVNIDSLITRKQLTLMNYFNFLSFLSSNKKIFSLLSYQQPRLLTHLTSSPVRNSSSTGRTKGCCVIHPVSLH